MAIEQYDLGASVAGPYNMLAAMRLQEAYRNALTGAQPQQSPTYNVLAQHGGPTRAAAASMDAYEMAPRDLLAGAIYSEAGGETPEGQLAVGAVMANRLKNGRWGDTWQDVILAPGQFSAFNGVTGYAGGEGANDLWRRPSPEAYRMADLILSGDYTDPTGGVLNYYNPSIASPAWGGANWQRIGNHVFGTAG